MSTSLSGFPLGFWDRKEGRRWRDVRELSVRETCYHPPVGGDKYLNSFVDFFWKKITVDVTKKFGMSG